MNQRVKCRVLAVGNIKGGVGKTTLAFNIAVALAGAKRDVLLVAADEGAVDLTVLRTTAKGEPGFTTVELRGANIRTQVRQLVTKYSDIVMDLGGEDETGSLRAALTVAHTILIPVKPRTLDLWRTLETVELVKEAREVNDTLRAVVVLNEADPSGQDNDEVLSQLRAVPDIEIAPFVIGRRKAFPNALASGLSVIEHHHDLKAAQELNQLVGILMAANVNTNDIGGVSYGNRKEA